MRAVNLLPKDQQGGGKSIRQEDPAVVVGSALGLIVVIALGASFMTAHGRAAAQQKKLTAAQLQLAQLSEKRKRDLPTVTIKSNVPVTPIIPPPAITGQEATWLSSVSQLLGQRIAWDRVLREVSLVMPDDVTLSALTMTAPSSVAVAGASPGTPSAQGFSIAGSAFSYDSVARLLSRLALVPDLSNVTLSNTTMGSSVAGSSGSGQVQFNITASVKGSAAPAAAPAAPAAPATTDTTSTGVSS